MAARSSHLIGQQFYDALVNAVVVRFDDPFAILLAKSDQTSLFDRLPQQRVCRLRVFHDRLPSSSIHLLCFRISCRYVAIYDLRNVEQLRRLLRYGSERIAKHTIAKRAGRADNFSAGSR